MGEVKTAIAIVANSRLLRALIAFIMAPLLTLIALALKVENPQAPILVRNSGGRLKACRALRPAGKLRFRANKRTRLGRILLRTGLDEVAALMDFRARRIFD
jgi:hypothetical protein